MTHLKKLSWNKLLRITVVTLLAFEITPACSQIAAQWRGNNRDGQYSGTNLLKAWPENGPELLWFTEEIGNGYGAPTIVNDRIYINGETDSVSYLFAFDLKGKLLWKAPNGKEFTGTGYASRFPGSRSAPTILGNLAYSCSGNGRIACYETSDGTEKWSIDMIKELGGREFEHGYSESLVVDAENVYCFPGGSTTNVAALNRFTGKPVWTSKAQGDTLSYCSPMLIKLPERKILLNYSRYFLFAVDCKNGELLWSYPLKGAREYSKNCNTPIYTGGYLYSVSAEANGGGGIIKFELSPDGRSLKEIWINNQVKNSLGGFVITNNTLFTTVEKNLLKAVELSQGTIVDSVKVRNGTLVFSDNKFFCYGNNGEVTLIDYDQNKLTVTGKLKIEKGSKDHFAHPAMANGILYIRHGKALMAYKVN